MLELKKIIPALILPPGIFSIISLALGAVFWRMRNKGWALVAFILGTSLWALSIGPTAEKLMSTLEKDLTIPSRVSGDVILLLGGGIHQGVQDLTGKGTPSNDMAGRIITAVRAQKELKAPIIISGGAVFSGQQPEAPVVRRILIDLGVPDKKVIVEAKSRDTVENARYCRQIIDSHGFKRPVLVTSAYHMKRSLEAFRKAGVKPVALPAQFHSGSGLPPVWVDFLPSAGALHTSCKALREQLGLLFYKLNR
jgi:uncharacterized SAM-binding protein YcdF (DUF218 family)